MYLFGIMPLIGLNNYNRTYAQITEFKISNKNKEGIVNLNYSSESLNGLILNITKLNINIRNIRNIDEDIKIKFDGSISDENKSIGSSEILLDDYKNNMKKDYAKNIGNIIFDENMDIISKSETNKININISLNHPDLSNSINYSKEFELNIDKNKPEGSGGETKNYVIDDKEYKIHKFTSGIDIFEVTSQGKFEIFLVGGGGGGGGCSSSSAGGGGGGGVVLAERELDIGEYELKVGEGGNRGEGTSNSGQKGGDTEIEDLLAIGGGGGAGATSDTSVVPTPGGSGGGPRNEGTSKTDYEALQPNTNNNVIVDAGYPPTTEDSAPTGNFGGGGADGVAGKDADGIGAGGPGYLSRITGEEIYYGAGGNGDSEGEMETSKGRTEIFGGIVETNTGQGGSITDSDTRSDSNKAGHGSDGVIIIRYEIESN